MEPVPEGDLAWTVYPERNPLGLAIIRDSVLRVCQAGAGDDWNEGLMSHIIQDAQAAAADAPDNVSAVLAVVESIERRSGTLGKRPGFRVGRELVAHLAAHVSRETLLRCLACRRCWEWRGWLECRRCIAQDDGTSKPAVTAATGGGPSAGAGLSAPRSTLVHAHASASVAVTHRPRDTIASLWERASTYAALAGHGPSVSDYDAYCNNALKHGVPIDVVVASVVHRLRAHNNLSPAAPPDANPDTHLCAHRGKSAPWCIRLIRFLIKHGNTCVNPHGVWPYQASQAAYARLTTVAARIDFMLDLAEEVLSASGSDGRFRFPERESFVAGVARGITAQDAGLHRVFCSKCSLPLGFRSVCRTKACRKARTARHTRRTGTALAPQAASCGNGTSSSSLSVVAGACLSAQASSGTVAMSGAASGGE